MSIELSEFEKSESFSSGPFVDVADDKAYYLDDARKLNINKLVHLAPYCELLLVQGAEGVGKSALLQRFVKRASESWRTALLQGEAALNPQLFLQQIIAALEIPHVVANEEQLSQVSLFEVVAKHLHALGQSGRRAIVVIDDSQALADEVLNVLERLLNDQRVNNALSLILSATPGFGHVVDRFPILKQKLAYSLSFEPFTREALTGYIEHRLRLADSVEDLKQFDKDTLDWVYDQSQGLPAKVNALARQVLAGDNDDVKRQRERPIMQWVLVSVIVGVAGVALYMQDDINRWFERAQVPPERADTEQALVVEASPEMLPALPSPLPEAPSVPQSVEPSLAVAEPQPVAPGELSPRPEPSEPEAPPAIPVVAEAAQAAATGADEAPAPSVGDDGAAVQLLAEAIRKPVTVELPGHEWLLAQDEQRYTLQLMALRDERKVIDFVERYQLAGKGGVYHLERDSGRLTAVVYGSFVSHEDAERAGASLPRAWGVGKPWIRKFSAVHADMGR